MSNDYSNCIGQIFQISNVGKGKLKYLGGVDGKRGTFCGMDLMGSHWGKNNGAVNGKQYFHCDFERSGLFVDFSKMKPVLDHFQQSQEQQQEQEQQHYNQIPATTVGATSENSNDDAKTQEIIAQYEQEILFLKKMVEDQHIVVENYEPVIVEYDEKVKSFETQIINLKEALDLERDSSTKQRAIFEREHEQLTRLVEDLQLQLKIFNDNSKMSSAHASNPATPQPNKDNNENIEPEVQESAEDKGEMEKELQFLRKQNSSFTKEIDFLKMQNSSLNKEYANLYRESMTQETTYEKCIEDLKKQLSETVSATPSSSFEKRSANTMQEENTIEKENNMP